MTGPRTCVILQPSYLPWRGYFHQIHEADVFVFYDDVQYDKGGWRNRNRIKTANGLQWLTVPVRVGGATDERSIDRIEIDGDAWRRRHWRGIEQAYARAPHFEVYRAALAPCFRRTHRLLCDLAIDTTLALADALGIGQREFRRASAMGIGGGRTERLVSICRSVGARRYVTGPRAAAYLDPTLFEAAGVAIDYMEYDYGRYPQLHGPYEPAVSVLDLLFMVGPEAGQHIWGIETS